ncbi:chitin deacetylase [Sporosarcina sp. P3]|uniref:polysaccharide deacetylase family protein n=1 Tax=Sporosarcina TaxID=1569 RepID=UPI0009DC63B6|nr:MULTISPECIES: polysaccharide deacetylase family protein [Sporosarcina]ARF17539.1 chitin deacetylase [Sporosarcina ureae]PID20372.1 chitin deacetylase [Sporosarcina sp. P3]
MRYEYGISHGFSQLKFISFLLLLSSFLLMGGCSPLFGGGKSGSSGAVALASQKVDPYIGEKSEVLSYVWTTRKELSLTFNGMADQKTMVALLDALEKNNIPATFFLPGIRVAEEPEIAKMILERGHEIENNTLNQMNLQNTSYEQLYKEVKLSNEVIRNETGVTPRYVRTRSGEYNEDLQAITAQLGMDAVVHYTINPREGDMQGAKSIGEYIERYITRGAIISMHTDINPEVVDAIPYIAKAVENTGYQLIPLKELIDRGTERKPLEQIAGYDQIKVNPNYKDIKPNIFYDAPTEEKVIALTFDDWASDYTVTKILDILKEEKVPSTFFLIGKGVEKNPNLARAIYEQGHEVASHSYGHEIVTEMTPEELQEDLVKAHKIITEAIQAKPTMLFRPATGEIDENTAKIAMATGYKSIALYDVTPFDWDTANDADEILKRVVNKRGDGSVIVLHILDGTQTIEALPKVIHTLRDQGYTFKHMTELMRMKNN